MSVMALSIGGETVTTKLAMRMEDSLQAFAVRAACFIGELDVPYSEEFDASYNRGEPLSFRLGVGQVISGWDQGVQGMKVGGRRKLVIPPHLGYGDRGAGGVIKPGETLIFVVDLLEVR